ncbi:unnamed protein product [Symbiodinium sp. CCMP2592]|nr:unnamed protein product [Symbiodinium sp. CCMP2592]CAE7350834.1 unnamed protein product [Symbiodinium sp. CCMP2592]
MLASDDESVLSATSESGELLEASDAEDVKRSYRSRRRREASFAGKAVCCRAFRSLLGVGETTLQRLRRGENIYTNKTRTPQPKHPTFGFILRGETAAKWMGVVMFLWYTYHTSAEYMPDNFRAAAKGSSFQAVAASDDTDVQLRAVNSFMKTLHTLSSDVDVHNIGPGTFAGERRFLPFGCRSEMYWQYRAYCESNKESCASYTTFMRLAKKVLGVGQRESHLKFRKVNEHAKCDTCVRLKHAMKAKLGVGKSREDQQKTYMQHLLSQWLDRQLYWQFRTMSQTFFRQHLMLGDRIMASSIGTSLMTLMIDGMDQSKYKVPRIRDQSSKLLGRLFRPTLHVAACWLHGRCLNFFVADECLKKNSETQLEMLGRTISEVMDSGMRLPFGLALQQDNTYREGKNQYVIAYLCLLVCLRVFRYTVASFLRPGHSHEDLDQVFSQQSAFIGRHCFDSASEVVQLIDSTYRPDDVGERERKRAKTASVTMTCVKLDSVALWQDWVAVLGLRFKGLRKVGQVRFCLRGDLDPSSYGGCVPHELTGCEPSPEDIMLLAKRFMADATPYYVACVVSAQRAADLRSSFQQPTGTADRRAISPKVRKNITALAPKCVNQGILSREAEAYLTNWCEGTWQKQPRPVSYSHLEYRRPDDRVFGVNAVGSRMPWRKPPRSRVINLRSSAERGSDDEASDHDNAEVDFDAQT